MILVQEAIAGFAETVPSVFQSRDPVFVECDRARRAIVRTQDAVVPHGKRDEEGYRKREEPRRRGHAEHEPRRERSCGNGGKTSVTDAGIEAGEASMVRCTRRPPPDIFIER